MIILKSLYVRYFFSIKHIVFLCIYLSYLMLRFEKIYTICLHLNRFVNGKEKNSPQTGFKSNTCTSCRNVKTSISFNRGYLIKSTQRNDFLQCFLDLCIFLFLVILVLKKIISKHQQPA